MLVPAISCDTSIKAMRGGFSGGTAASLMNVVREVARDPEVRQLMSNPYAVAPGAAHLAELRDEMAAGGVVCLFPEIGHDAKRAAQLAEATGLTPAGALDPEGSFIEPGAALYGQMLRAMAGTIADCAK